MLDFHAYQSCLSVCSMYELKSPKRIVDSIDPTLWRALLTLSIKAWHSLTAFRAYIYNRHNDRSCTLSFNIQVRDPKGIQSNTQFDNWGFVRILTPALGRRTWISTWKKSIRSPSKSTIPEPSHLVEETPTISYWYIFLCLFYQIQFFSCECENIPVAKQQSVMVFPKVCDITLSTIILRCPRPPLQMCSGHVGGAA